MIKHATELIGKVPEVYSLARLPPDLSFEETFQNMKTLLDEGLFGAYGASEMKRESLEKAQKVNYISTLSSVALAHFTDLSPSPSTFTNHLVPSHPAFEAARVELPLISRSSQSPTSKLKSRSGPTNKISRT